MGCFMMNRQLSFLAAFCLFMVGCAEEPVSTYHDQGLERGAVANESECYDTPELLRERYAGSPAAELQVTLHDFDFDFGRLETATGDARRAVIDERKTQLAPSQQQVERYVVESGGELLSRRWLTNHLLVRVAPETLGGLIALPEVAVVCDAIAAQPE